MRSSRLAERLEANAQNAMFRVKRAVLAVFQESLDRLGWTVGRNVQIDYRWYGGDKERARIGAAELLALFARRHRGECQPRHIVPIAITVVTDPVGEGFVQNFARPGGNI